jgi:outer membrane cobalamin receptor
MLRRSARLAVSGLILLTTTSCLGAAAGDPDVDNTSPTGRIVTAEDIARSDASTAWEALGLLGGYLRLEEDSKQRPVRITARGRSSILLRSEPQVFMDGVRLVEYTVLKNMDSTLIEQIELVTGPRASIRYGTNAGHGVIVITTRSGRSGGAGR